MGVIRKHAAHSPILSDLKTIYQAADEQKAQAALDRVTEKWSPKYPNSMKRRKDNRDAVSLQIPLHRIIDSASNGSVFPVVTEHFSASSDHAFL